MEKPTEAEKEMARPYIELANESLSRFSDYKPIRYDSIGSVKAALQMIEVAGGDRGLGYFRLALNEYQPHRSGDEAPKSLAHPFFLRGVKRRALAYNRDQAKGQLSMLFVERSDTPPRAPLYVPDPPGQVSPEVGAAVLDELAKTLKVVR